MKKYFLHSYLAISFVFIITSLTAQNPIIQNPIIITSGAGTWYPPPGVKSFYVQVWGGGAGGNSQLSTSGIYTSETGGGGGGSFSLSNVFTVTAASYTTGYSFTVGAGGGYNVDGQDTKFENCWAYKGLRRTLTKQKYTGPDIAASYFGGYGGSSYRDLGAIYYGGGGGSAYSNADGNNGSNGRCCENGTGGTGTGNGGNGPSNSGNAPGGGGAGNGSGARGEIRIFYTCENYTAGKIGTSHTVPYEWELKGTDVINNLENPTGFGYTYSWERSTNSTNWTVLTGPGTSSAAYILPELQQNTWYRRLINGCNLATNRTDSILIKVYSLANGLKNGTISGKVVSKNGVTGVAGISITVRKTVALKGSPVDFPYTDTTDQDGNYSIQNIFYGDASNGDPGNVNFTVTPSKQGHFFLPANRTVALSVTNPGTNLPPVNFTDTTVYAISGRITQTCDSCLSGSKGPFGVGNVKITDGSAQALPVYSDSLKAGSIGNYATTVSDPGIYTFTPSFLNHQFSPLNRIINVTADVDSVNFADTTTRLISGKLVDIAGKRIGTAQLLFTGIFQRKDSTVIETFKKRVTINTGDSSYAVRLPAGTYNVSVETFAPAYLSPDVRSIPQSDVIDFFNVRAIEPLIDVSLKDDTARNLVYHRRPTIILTGLTDTLCNNDLTKDPGIVFRSNILKYFQVNVFEGSPSLNNRILTSDPRLVDSSDANSSDFLRIFTNVTDLSDAANASEKLFRMVNSSNAFMLDTFLIPGAPQTTSPHFKPFELRYTDRYGRIANPVTRRATVTGTFNPAQTFTTSFPEKPYLILHAPPGDQSYSFWSKDVTAEVSTRYSVAKDSSRNAFLDISYGPSISITTGPVSFDATVIASVNQNFNHSSSTVTGKEEVSSVTNTVAFETKKSNLFLKGTSGDVYIGAGTNYKVGNSITVDFDETQLPGGCLIKKQIVMIMSPQSFRTEFAYTEDHIVNFIIPTQQKLAEQGADKKERDIALEQVSIWQQVIRNNDKQKKDAKFKLNRSFSYGVVVNESQTGTSSTVNTLTYNVTIDTSLARPLGLYVGGLGASGGIDVTISETQGFDKTSTRTTSTTMGYRLEDDNRGDYYSVDIKTDPVYGTPVFDLVAGTSSCPPEEGAQNRDLPQIITGDMTFDSLDVNTVKDFIMTVTNKSESGETRNYTLSVDQITSAGLTVTTDGYNLKNPLPFTFLLPYDQSLDVPIKVEKSNKTDKKLSYPNVEFYATDNCNLPDLLYPNTISTAKISFNYKSLCGNIALSAPLDGWVVNSGNINTLPISMNGYVLSGLDSITLEYASNRTRSKVWKSAFTIKKDAINDPVNFNYSWNTATLTDSIYSLRLKQVCLDGSISYSRESTGVIDRQSPSLVGKPQPASRLYNPEDGEISFNYSESIDNTNLNQGAVEILRRSNNTSVPVSVREVDGKLIIKPLNSLGSTIDSFRVIVKNITDLYGNIKTKSDTSFFKLDLTTLVTYTGTNVAKVFVTPASIAENSTGKMELHFKLKEKVTKITKVFFNLTGSAMFNTDYNITYDTIRRKVCVDSQCTATFNLPVLNKFSDYLGFVNIDSNKTEAIIYVDPLEDAENEGNETITITLANGSDYKLQDSVTATGTILNSALPCPPANTLYVNEKATGNNSGVSWVNAMRSVKEALNSTCPAVTQIWVAKGTYKPTTNNSRDSSFVMKNNLAIYGGFAGTETALSQRNIRINPTILSGDIGIANSNADNSFNVVRNISNGLNATAILDGFIVTGGRGNGPGFGSYGAGVINVSSTPSFFNCSIVGNAADAYGGGMYNNGTAPAVVNSVFSGNTALYGGGLYNESAATRLFNCSFSGNIAFAEGGAVSTYGAVVPEITNSILWGNSSGIRNAGGSAPAVTYSIIQGGYAGTGNLNIDPLFILQPAAALTNTGDLRLLGCSPAVNIGSNAALPAGITIDLASLPRVANTIIDMGAYERQSPATSVIIYVDIAASGNNSGESWANAYNNLSSAIAELNFCSPGTTIQVAAGTYTAPLNTTFNFDKLGATIFGGYPTGGGTRNPVANLVTLKGNVQVLKSVRMDGIRLLKQ